MMSYRARERDMQAALVKINQMDEVSEPTVLIRVEGRDE
jgi:hypothetical protein